MQLLILLENRVMKELISIFKALSDRNRLRIVSALIGYDELCACQITELLEISSATSSRHLGVLINANLVQSRKDGRWVYYCINRSSSSFESVIQWIEHELKDDEEAEHDRKLLKVIVDQEPVDICRKQRGVTCCPQC